jgi:molybdenum cofactor cytidylyltransferase
MRTLGVLLAAGQSRRFGAADKLLANYRGRALVSWAAGAMEGDVGCAELAVVTSSPEVACQLPRFTQLHLPAGLPMSLSFACAARHAQRVEADALLLVLGDMPAVTAALLRRLVAQGASTACTHEGRRMPPALLVGADIFSALDQQAGDHGARNVIAALPRQRLISISAEMARDIDYPDDLCP